MFSAYFNIVNYQVIRNRPPFNNCKANLVYLIHDLHCRTLAALHIYY